MAAVLLAGLVSGILVGVERLAEAAARSNCSLGQLGLAFHLYADTHGGRLPPAAVCDSEGRPLLSWRVLVLPYLEQKDLFDEFRMNEPWDSEHNLRLVSRMPRTYQAPWKKVIGVPDHHTVLHVFVGPGAAFEWNRGLSLKDDFPDGLSDTLLYVESGPPVPWTKPEEIPFEPGRPIPLQGLFRAGCRSGTVDGKGYQMIPNDYDEQALRACITRNGGETGVRVWSP